MFHSFVRFPDDWLLQIILSVDGSTLWIIEIVNESRGCQVDAPAL